MPHRHAAHKRAAGDEDAVPHHGLICEFIIEGVMLAASLMFVFGSLCFFGGEPFQILEIGEILFIIASVIYVIVGILEMHELCASVGSGVIRNSIFHEQMAYLVAATIFMAGTVLFWPNIYKNNPEWEELGTKVAAWCFVVGSTGFVIASFWNALSLADIAGSNPAGEAVEGSKTLTRLTNAALFCSLMGGMFFVTGSYLYTLDVEEGCAPDIPLNVTSGSQPLDSPGGWCLDVVDQGTVLYFIGSLFYLVQSISNSIRLCLTSCVNPHTGYCEVSVHEEEDSRNGTERILVNWEEAEEAEEAGE